MATRPGRYHFWGPYCRPSGGMESNEAAGEDDCSVDATVLLPMRPGTIGGWPACESGASVPAVWNEQVKSRHEGPPWALCRGFEEKE